MSNSSKNTIHELIKHLSKSEKRYFKIFASRHIIGEENNYVVLFDFIDKMENYDEELIYNHFKGAEFLNNLSITKKRLYDHIINSLDQFHSSNSIEAQIYKLLSTAEILNKKSLYQQSLKQLKSAEKLALKHDKLFILGEINYKLKHVFENLVNLDKVELNEIFSNDIEIQKNCSIYNQLWNIKSNLFNLLSLKGSNKFEQELAEFKTTLNQLKVEIIVSNLEFDAKYLFNHIFSAYYFATKEYELCFESLKNNIFLLETKEYALIDKPNRYISVLSNAIFVAHQLNKKEELYEFKSKLSELRLNPTLKMNDDLQIKLFSSYYSIEITLLILENKIDEALNIIPIIEEGIVKYNTKLTEVRKAFFYYKIASCFLLKNQFTLANKYIHKILQNNQIDFHEELVSMTQLLSLLINLEIEKGEVFQCSLRNTQRSLKNKGRFNQFETILLKGISKISKGNNKIEREESWEELYIELNSFNGQQLNQVSFDYFDFISWAKSKFLYQSVELK
jgi:hypothetical protein